MSETSDDVEIEWHNIASILERATEEALVKRLKGKKRKVLEVWNRDIEAAINDIFNTEHRCFTKNIKQKGTMLNQ